MKTKILIVVTLVFAFFACKNEPQNYVTVSGEIKGKTEKVDTVFIYKSQPNSFFQKKILVDESGAFQDTLKVASDVYNLRIGEEYSRIYLTNGDEVQLSVDYQEFDETLAFEGKGISKEVSNFLIQDYLLDEAILQNLGDEFVTKYPEAEKEYSEARNELKNEFTQIPDSIWTKLDKQYQDQVEMTYLFLEEAKKAESLEGKMSPAFEFETLEGKSFDWESLKGKPVYIDVWATWCGPCKQEIPYLKKLENEYEAKGIQFLSVSIDPEKDKEKWKDFVNEKELGGIQVFAKNAWESDIVKAYFIQGIPRFVLLDAEGKIYKSNAPRPSNPKSKEILDELL